MERYLWYSDRSPDEFLNELERGTLSVARPLLFNESGYYSQIDRSNGKFLIRYNQMLIRPYRYFMYGTVVATSGGSMITAQYQMRKYTRTYLRVLLLCMALSIVTMLVFGFPARTLFNAFLILGFALLIGIQYLILRASKGNPEDILALISQAAGQAVHRAG